MSGLSNAMNGASLKFTDTALVQQYANSIKGLNLQQAQLALSTKILSDKQKEQILVQAGLKASEDAIQGELLQSALIKAGIGKEEQESIFRKLNLWNLEKGELLTQKTCTKADLEAALAQELKNKTDERGILTTLGVGNANIWTAETFKLLGKTIGQAFVALMTNPFTYLVAGLVSTIVVIKQTTEAIEGIRDKAQELGSSFNDSKSEIEGYKSQIQDLYKTINDSGSSIEEVTNARQTLMTVQDELIDKFGDEKETIDLVTQAINGQSSALGTLIDKQWQETKNKFNEGTFWGDFANWSQGFENNLERMTAEMENPVVRIGMSINDFNSGDYAEIIQYMEELGWTFSDSVSAFTKNGGLENLYEDILQIQTVANKDNAPAHFLKELTSEANKAKDTLDDYEGLWDNYILNDRIFEDDSLANSWKEVNDAYTEYQRAVQSGDKAAIESSIAGFASSINTVLDAKNVDDSVKDYFRDMYPALYREVEKWEFKTTVIPDFDISGLQGKTQADILKMLQTDGTQEGEDIFNSIIESAKSYGLIIDINAESIQKILDLLVEWGILQGTISENAPDLDKTVISLSNLKSASEGLEPVQKAFKELNDDGFITFETLSELQTATGLSGEAWDDYQEKLMKAKAGSTEFAQIMDDFTYKILENKFETIGLENATEDHIAAVLREKDVAKATTKAREYYNRAQEQSRIKTALAKDGAANNIVALAQEESQLGLTEEAVVDLIVTEIAFNNTTLDVDGKINALKDLAEQYGITTSMAAGLNNVLAGSGLSEGEQLKKQFEFYGIKQSRIRGGDVVYKYNGQTYGTAAEALSAAQLNVKTPENPWDGINIKDPSGSDSTKNEALDNYLDSIERAYKYHEDELRYINDLQYAYDKLTKSAEEREEILDKINEAQKDYTENQINDLEHANELLENQGLKGNDAYIANLEKIKQLNHEAAESYRELLRGMGYDDETIENTGYIQERQKGWYDADNQIKDILQDNFDDKINDLEHKIQLLENINEQDEHYSDNSTRMTRYNRTQEINDYYRQLQAEIHNQAEELRKQGYTDDMDEIQELQNKWWEFENAIRDNISSMTELKVSAYTEQLEDDIKALALKYDKEQAITSALEKRYDVQRQIRDKQAEIDAELASSKALPEYLEDNSTLFNDKDYKRLSDELSRIDTSIIGLYNDYRREINNLAEDEWYKQEEITAQFERQLEVAMDKYELAEKELELTKKRLEYDNIIKQRDTRIMVAGHWINTPDPDKVREITQEKARLEAEKENLVLTQAEDATIRGMEAINNATNTERLAIQNRVDMIEEMTELERKAYADRLPVDVLEGVKVNPEVVEAPKVEVPVAEKQNVRYIGIDENNNLISESLPDGRGFLDAYAPLTQSEYKKYSPIFGLATDYVKTAVALAQNTMSNNGIGNTYNNLVNRNENNTSNVVQYTLTGDIHIDNPIGDPNDFAHALASQMGQRFDVTKNMKK